MALEWPIPFPHRREARAQALAGAKEGESAQRQRTMAEMLAAPALARQWS